MSFILTFKVTAQVIFHFSRTVEVLKVGTLEFLHDVFHIQRFDFLFGKNPHVVDQKLLAGDRGMRFSNDDAIAFFEQGFEDGFCCGVGLEVRNGRARVLFILLKKTFSIFE
ncbi:hypothetical protein D3C85_1377870 [compost metagenome]